MTSTLKMLRDDLRDRLSEADARQWSDAELNRWINEGARDLTRRTECIRDSYDISGVQSQGEYTGPTDIVRLHLVTYDDGSGNTYDLEYRDFNSMSQVWGSTRDAEGRPMFYTTWGMPPNLKITVFPKPLDSLGTITVRYYRFAATALDDLDTIEVPTGWEDAVVLYAEMTAFRKDGDQRWTDSKALYMEKMADLLATSLRFTDAAGQIDRWDGGGHLPAWLVEG